jgi:hypothetical protein
MLSVRRQSDPEFPGERAALFAKLEGLPETVLQSTNRERQPREPVVLGRAWTLLAAAVVCVTLTLLTLPRFQGDSIDYTDEIRTFDETGGGLPGSMLDFGHIIWRWCGYGLFHLARPLWLALGGGSIRYAYFWPFLVLSWAAGCWALYLCLRLAGHFTANRMVIAGAGLAFVSGNAVLNNLHSGTPYLPGLAMVLASTLWLLDAACRDGTSWRGPMWAGIALAAAVSFWFPYILLAPAVLLAPLLLAGGRRGAVQLALRTALAAAFSLTAVYAIPVIYLRLFSITQFKDWETGSSHGWDQNRRFLRWIFGFPRAYLFLANDGILFKRYLFHDPYAKVSALDLMRASLAKAGFFFAYVTAVTWALIRRKEKGPLLWYLCGLAPCTVFAIFVFESGSMERYIPIIPFLLAGSVIACEQRWARYVCAAFVLLAVCDNIPAYWAPLVRHEYGLTELRVQDLKDRFKPASVAFITHRQDDLSTIRDAYVFHPVNRENWLQLYIVAAAGTTFARSWREFAAERCFESWSHGGEVWMSDRFFAQRPEPQWDWTEGDDPNLRWAELNVFFRQFDRGIDVGAPDGFTLLEKTAKNTQILASLLANAPRQTPVASLSPTEH